MATTIEQIRKVNIYEEDKDHNRTLVQENVPLGSNVVMEGEAPEAEELYLLTGKEDKVANTITLYPTKVKVTSGGSIDASDFTMSNSTINGKYVSTITWNEGEETSTDGIKTYARRLYYNTNSNPFQVKDKNNQSLNLLRVPYLALYSTNTIKTEEKNPLYLNVENVTVSHLANNTKVVLGHTAIKNSALDIVDNTNGYLRARLGADMTNNYGYLNFFKTITENKVTTNYEIGSIFANSNNEVCIMPRKIPCSDINTIDNKKEIKNDNGEVIGGSIGASLHKFRDVWAENLHGNIAPVVYTSPITTTNEGEKYLKTYTSQFIYIDPNRGNSMKDLPEGSKEGFCFTLSASATNKKFKQIFLNTEINNNKNKYLYVRTGQKDSNGYEEWHKIGTSEWINRTIVKNANLPTNDNDYKTKKPLFIFSQQYLDIYKNNRMNVKARGIMLEDIRKEVKKDKDHLYYLKIAGVDFMLVFGCRYKNDTNIICLWGGYTSNNNSPDSEQIQFKQYD